MFENKVILITGGTGFLGRALTRKLLTFNPQSIRIFSRDEVKHFNMAQEFNDPKLRFLIGDVRDEARLVKALQGVDYVIHAAALKRLDLIEFNTDENVKTNIQGTLNVINACEKNQIKKMVFISSDKACSPINTYGASKFVSERIVTESNYNNGGSGTIYLSVRYGNVINSTGSIVPILQKKIINGESFHLTDERMTRFIITEEDAIKLILDAFEFGVGGEIVVPKLDSCKITDLMEAIKKVNKYSCETKITGLRPGEKIHELMINELEGSRLIDYKGRYIIPSLIQEYKQNVLLAPYLDQGEKIIKGDYSSETEIIPVESIIEKYHDYLIIK